MVHSLRKPTFSKTGTDFFLHVKYHTDVQISGVTAQQLPLDRHPHFLPRYEQKFRVTCGIQKGSRDDFECDRWHVSCTTRDRSRSYLKGVMALLISGLYESIKADVVLAVVKLRSKFSARIMLPT